MNRSQMSCVLAHPNLRAERLALGVHEDTLLGGLRRTLLLHSVRKVRLGPDESRIEGKGSIDVTSSLVELNCLPSVFGCLTDERIRLWSNVRRLRSYCLRDVAFYLIFVEPQG